MLPVPNIGLLTPIVAIIGAKGFDEISGLWARGFGSKAPPIPPPIICIVCAMVWVKMLLAAVGSFDTQSVKRHFVGLGGGGISGSTELDGDLDFDFFRLLRSRLRL